MVIRKNLQPHKRIRNILNPLRLSISRPAHLLRYTCRIQMSRVLQNPDIYPRRNRYRVRQIHSTPQLRPVFRVEHHRLWRNQFLKRPTSRKPFTSSYLG